MSISMANSTTEIVTMTPSKQLKESLMYSRKPRPINLNWKPASCYRHFFLLENSGSYQYKNKSVPIFSLRFNDAKHDEFKSEREQMASEIKAIKDNMQSCTGFTSIEGPTSLN